MNGDNIQIKVPLEQWVVDIVDRTAVIAAQRVIDNHARECAAREAVPKLYDRIGRLEVKLGTMIGLMLGSGAVGGSLAVGLLKLVGS